MGFWERLIGWFGRKPTPETVAANTAERSKPTPTIAPIKIPTTDGSTLPLPGNSSIDIFRLLFSNKDKYTTVMLNSISLSSDMRTLYLIDNGRAIAYDLTVPQGVLVGLLGDQLVVATAVGLPDPDDDVDPGLTTETGGGSAIDAGSRSMPETQFTFKIGEKSQYSLSYNAQRKALGVIGTTDIVLNLEEPDSTGECVNVFTSLDQQAVIRIQRSEDELRVTKVN